MHPGRYFSLFPPFPRKNQVFVIMSFDPRFNHRWEKVIAPAIQAIGINDVRLKAERVDVRTISDSILTEIIGGIGESLLVFADITTIGHLEDRPIRNGNAMYELGIAHAVRQPEEVVVFRSDRDNLLFDVTHVRVNSYDPDGDYECAFEKVRDTLAAAIMEINNIKNLSVRAAAESLDYDCLDLLISYTGRIDHSVTRTTGDALTHPARIRAISKLIELGILSTEFLSIDLADEKIFSLPKEAMVSYHLTPFGQAVHTLCLQRLLARTTDLPAAKRAWERRDPQGAAAFFKQHPEMVAYLEGAAAGQPSPSSAQPDTSGQPDGPVDNASSDAGT